MLVSPALRAQSSKLRVDDVYQLAARAGQLLDEQGRAALWASYSVQLRRSNVAYSPSSPAHALDHDDRNYSQHVIEAGVELRH